VWTFIEDSLRFVKRINPHLKLQNVNGDGNCGYWAVLASLRESITRNRIPQDSPLMQIPIIQAVAQKHDLNTWAPESTDHDLMSQLRVATQRDNIRELCQRQLTALELYLDEQTPPDRNPSALRNLLSLEPQAPANATRNNDGSSNGKTAEDWRAKVLTDIIKSAQELQQRVHKAKVPQEVKAQLWLELGEDAPDLVKAINLPLLVLTPPSQENPQWGAEGLETNGDSKSWENTFEGAGKGPWTAIPSLINLWIQDLPSLVKILNSGTHFLAVVDDDTPEEASHPPQMPPQVSRGPQSRKKS
jgi:hypothetical protein